MNSLKFSTLLLLLLLTQIGRGDPLDTWTLRSLSLIDKPVYGIAYGNGQFVAVVWDGSVLTSPDGVNWVQRRTGTTNYLHGITYGNGQFVAVGGGQDNATGLDLAGTIVTSADGTNWVQRSSVATTPLLGVFYLHGQFVAAGESGAIVTSADGANWVQQDLGGLWLDHIAYGSGQFVGIGVSALQSPIVLTSADGTNWVHVQAPATDGLSGIVFGNGQFVAVGGRYPGSTSTIETSHDGVNWVQRQADTSNQLIGIGYGNGQFVAVGGGQDNATGLNLAGTIVTSPDGVNWVQRPSGTTNSLFATIYGNGHFVAVGDCGTILQSGSIINLSITPNATTGLLSLSLEGPTGLDYSIQTSTDLISWQDVTKITGLSSGKIILDGLSVGTGRVFYRAYSQ